MHFMLPIVFALGASLSASSLSSFYDPRIRGGSQINKSGNGGEPLNVIVSGLSSPHVLTARGFLNYARAIGLSKECLGLHKGTAEPANLGDGNGWVNEREVIREHYNIPIVGTCIESLVGGNHFRTYRQNGSLANSGALFLAVSQEESLAQSHNIVPNGYNIGRDKLVKSAVGRRTFLGVTYNTTVEEITGLLQPGAEGINHGIAQDGVVKLLTVTIQK